MECPTCSLPMYDCVCNIPPPVPVPVPVPCEHQSARIRELKAEVERLEDLATRRVATHSRGMIEMAWNPGPEVAAARDAAKALGADRCVVIYTTGSGQCGMASYGKTKKLCDRLKPIGVKLHRDAMKYFEEDDCYAAGYSILLGHMNTPPPTQPPKEQTT